MAVSRARRITKIDHCRLVDDGCRIGAHDDRCNAASGRRLAGGGKGLSVFCARFPDEGTHIDETRRDNLAAAVDDFGAFRHARRTDAALGVADHTVGEQHVAGEIEIARGIDDPRVGQQDGTAVGQHQF